MGALPMSVVKSGLVAIVFAVASLFAASAGAQAQTFSFVVCNHSSVQASVATASHASPTDANFVVQGWWSVGAGACVTIGSFPQGTFYYYAEQTNTQQLVWKGTDAQVCVQYPGPFTRTNTANYTCASNEELRGFTLSTIAANIGTFTWNLN
jgi:uncharacterized membrane protein